MFESNNVHYGIIVSKNLSDIHKDMITVTDGLIPTDKLKVVLKIYPGQWYSKTVPELLQLKKTILSWLIIYYNNKINYFIIYFWKFLKKKLF